MKRAAYALAGRLPSGIKRLFVRVAGATFLVGVLGIVLDEDGRVLLFRHTYRPFAPWGLPSGLLKPNESPAEAIEREVHEETGLIIEVVLTAGFLFVIMGATDSRAPSGFAPLAIGLTLTLIHLISIPVTNTSVNPARSTGSALLVGGWALAQLWLFWLAPILGGIVGGVA